MSLIVDGKVDAIAYDVFVEAIVRELGWNLGSGVERIPENRWRYAHFGIYEIRFDLLSAKLIEVMGMMSYLQGDDIIPLKERNRSVTTSTAKAPQIIAREIKIRLLEDYQPKLDQAIANHLKDQGKLLEVQAFAIEMANKLGEKLDPLLAGKKGNSILPMWKDVKFRLSARFSPGSTSITLDYLTDSQTEDLIDFINNLRHQSLKDIIELLRDKDGTFHLSAVKEWAKANKLDYLDKPSHGVGGNYIAVFTRSHNMTYQVFIHREGVSVEISAV